ncbi:MAG: hypothetical protein RI957_783 [Verrucomicrobiota bacterium]|jgi:hypothetical protein
MRDSNQNGGQVRLDISAGKSSKRHAHEGKSVDYTLDDLIHPSPVAEKNLESTWEQKRSSVPDIVIWFSVVAASLLLLGVFFWLRSDKSSNSAIPIAESPAGAQEMTNIHDSLLASVREYLSADTIEKKLPHVRNPGPTKQRMEQYHADHPLIAQTCESFIKIQPFFYKQRQLWHVTAKTGRNSAVALMLEQMADGKFLVDWESHVDYQPMPWKQYLEEKPNKEMTFRVTVQDSTHYAYEFSSETQWAAYELTQSHSEETAYGYVLRDSDAHKALTEALSQGPKRMILRLQASKGFAAQRAFVIKDLISDSIYRIEPPSSLDD